MFYNIKLLLSKTNVTLLKYTLNQSGLTRVNNFHKSACVLFSYENDDHSSKYKIYKDEDSSAIFDVDEERLKKQEQNKLIDDSHSSSTSVINEKIRLKGFDLQDLVSLVKTNKGKHISVIKLPPELKYVDYMIIVSGLSTRHLTGMAEAIRKEYKVNVNSIDTPPNIEGKNSNWIALDLGNIALHLMLDSVRTYYDLESLWAIGRKYDVKLNAKDNDELQLLKHHSINLDELVPSEQKFSTASST